MPCNTINSQVADQDIDRGSFIWDHWSHQASPTPALEDPQTPTNLIWEPDNNNPPTHNHNKDPLEDPFANKLTPNLAEAIMLMMHELTHRETAQKASNSKVKEPDTFDGSDPKKLSNFILLCNPFFHNSSAYSEGDAKVTSALFHLCGTALEYFEPTILAEEHEDWMDNWSAFSVLSLVPSTLLQMLLIISTI